MTHSRRELNLVSATHDFYSSGEKTGHRLPGRQPVSEVRWNLPSLDYNQLCLFVDATAAIRCCYLLILPHTAIKLGKKNKLKAQ